MNKEAVNGRSANEARLLAPTLSVTEATVTQLQERVQSTVRAENQAVAIRAETVAELRRREGEELTEAVLREKALLSRLRARSEMDTAVELSELPHASDGLRKGDISYDNARIIAGASQRGEINETELAEVAKTQSPDKFAGDGPSPRTGTFSRRWYGEARASAVPTVREGQHRSQRRNDRPP